MVRGFNLFGGGIKSVQRGYTNMGAFGGFVSLNVNIASVNITKSIIMVERPINYTSRPDYYHVRGRFVDNTTIEFKRHGLSTDCGFYWQIIEFDDSVTVQSGLSQINTSATSASATIGTVNLSKSFCVCSTYCTDTTPNADRILCTMVTPKLSSTTQIRFDRNINISSSYGINYVAWFVVTQNE